MPGRRAAAVPGEKAGAWATAVSPIGHPSPSITWLTLGGSRPRLEAVQDRGQRSNRAGVPEVRAHDRASADAVTDPTRHQGQPWAGVVQRVPGVMRPRLVRRSLSRGAESGPGKDSVRLWSTVGQRGAKSFGVNRPRHRTPHVGEQWHGRCCQDGRVSGQARGVWRRRLRRVVAAVAAPVVAVTVVAAAYDATSEGTVPAPPLGAHGHRVRTGDIESSLRAVGPYRAADRARPRLSGVGRRVGPGRSRACPATATGSTPWTSAGSGTPNGAVRTPWRATPPSCRPSSRRCTSAPPAAMRRSWWGTPAVRPSSVRWHGPSPPTCVAWSSWTATARRTAWGRPGCIAWSWIPTRPRPSVC